MPSAGAPATNQQRVDSKHQDNMSGDKRMMRKSGKTKTSYDGKKMKTKMKHPLLILNEKPLPVRVEAFLWA